MKKIVAGLLSLVLFVFSAGANSPPELQSRAAVVMDAATGTFVFLQNPDMEIPPASLTKLMTMHLALREVAAGRASLDEVIVPPPESWAVNQPPRSSLMFLGPGQRLTLRELLLGLSIPSGNDAAVAAALRFAPSVPEFASMMTREAQAMGLTRTRFVEPSGISEYNMTTAREFAYFSRAYLALWPESLMAFHSLREFSFPQGHNVANPHGAVGTITQMNRNSLLEVVKGVDGLRTGFIYASGFNISLTAERNGTRFIAVILGAPSESSRHDDGRELLEWAFDSYRTVRPQIAALEPVRVWRGRENYVPIGWGAPLEFTAAAGRGEALTGHIEFQSPLVAPLPAGSPVGHIALSDSLGELHRVPVVTARDVERGGFFKRLFDSLRLFFARGRG